MKALTISPPWPFAIFHLGKDCENRVWTPAPSELKPGDWFLVHGGRTPFTSKGAVQNTEYGVGFRMSVNQLLMDLHAERFTLTPEQTKHMMSIATEVKEHEDRDEYCFSWAAFHLPGIIGAVQYLGHTKGHDSYWAVRGQNHWLLGEKVLFPNPIPCRGAQKLWDVPEDVHQQAREQYKAARLVSK